MTAPPAGALEACPFCGAPGELLGSDVMWPLVIATCSGDCELMPSTHPASEADAIAAWNRRTHGPALLAALRLREACEFRIRAWRAGGPNLIEQQHVIYDYCADDLARILEQTK